jgi:predicted nucleotidyltransferase
VVSMRSIKDFSKRIAEEYKPQTIILFGSYAAGRATADSDVDLLVVMPYEGRSVNQSVEMRMRLRPSFPLDLLIRTPDAVRQRLEIGDTFLHDILQTGKVLYEADHV